MATPYAIDPYIIDTLMGDLVGHDHRPSAFPVYLAMVAAATNGRVALSFADLAERTGLSKRTAQYAVATLRGRGLIEVSRRGATETPEYSPLAPWRR